MAPKKRKNAEQQDSTDDESSSKRNKTESGLKFGFVWREAGEKGAKNLKPLIYLSADLPGCKKIASFDIDGTIIVTKSGKTFAQNSSDWKWFDKCVPQKLKDLDDQGFRIVFITNQAGIEKGKTKPEQLKTKFEAMLKELHIPVFILIATGENHFRKPSVEMWKFFEENCNKMEEVDMDESFYCGDAAGRPKNWAPGRSKDFSCGDRMFAANCNLKFYTPEEFFLNHRPVKFEWGSVDPLEVIKKYKNSKQDKEYHSTVQEIVMMFGPPASGKSTFYRRYLKDNNYVHVNRDTLQTQEKCLKAAEAALKEGKSVCVDNTNPSKKIRADYISLAKRMNVSQVRCFVLNTPIELCHHLNYVRQNCTLGKVRRIPDVGYNMFKSQLQEPDVKEGFEEVVKIDFVPIFDDEQHEKIFKQWTN
ncbi:bifunctional polynucleotide phosphatase kinase-like [Brachionus plicatilis]|uniref:Bifunctional polynucleotide phosphatase kinase-like n=1 Tax=Brachionus plicatilis TaxID=10195 RepID=A0A3M7RJ10_BRAPC|nr:bifunctional polynucleotide phosphatase kinase-like [Brachionus plicatilis]